MNEDLSSAILETVAKTMGLSGPMKTPEQEQLFNTLCAYCNWKLIFEEEWDWPRGRRTPCGCEPCSQGNAQFCECLSTQLLENSFDRWNLED